MGHQPGEHRARCRVDAPHASGVQPEPGAVLGHRGRSSNAAASHPFVSKYRNCTEYWLDPESATFRGEFEAMYRDIADPWGCDARKSDLNNRIFVEIMFSGSRKFDRSLDVGCELGGQLQLTAARNGAGDVLGVDVAATAIAKAAARHPSLRFRCHNLLERPL